MVIISSDLSIYKYEWIHVKKNASIYMKDCQYDNLRCSQQWLKLSPWQLFHLNDIPVSIHNLPSLLSKEKGPSATMLFWGRVEHPVINGQTSVTVINRIFKMHAMSAVSYHNPIADRAVTLIPKILSKWLNLPKHLLPTLRGSHASHGIWDQEIKLSTETGIYMTS